VNIVAFMMSIMRKLTERVWSVRMRNGMSACREWDSIDKNMVMSTRSIVIVVSVVVLF